LSRPVGTSGVGHVVLTPPAPGRARRPTTASGRSETGDPTPPSTRLTAPVPPSGTVARLAIWAARSRR